MAAASSCGSRSERTTSHVSLDGDCRIGKNIAGCGIFREVHVLSVFHNAHHLDARPVAQLVIPPHRVAHGAEDLARKLPVDHRHARRIWIVVPGERSCPASRAVPAAWKYSGDMLNIERRGRGVRRPQIGGFVGKDSVVEPRLIQRRHAGQSPPTSRRESSPSPRSCASAWRALRRRGSPPSPARYSPASRSAARNRNCRAASAPVRAPPPSKK